MEPGRSLPYSKEPTLVSITSQIIDSKPSYFLKIHFNIILHFSPMSSKWSLSLRFTHRNPVCTSPLPSAATCHSQIFLLDLITWIKCVEQHRSGSSSLCHFLQSPVAPSLLGPHIFLNTPSSNTLSPRPSLVSVTISAIHLKWKELKCSNSSRVQKNSNFWKRHYQI